MLSAAGVPAANAGFGRMLSAAAVLPLNVPRPATDAGLGPMRKRGFATALVCATGLLHRIRKHFRLVKEMPAHNICRSRNPRDCFDPAIA